MKTDEHSSSGFHTDVRGDFTVYINILRSDGENRRTLFEWFSHPRSWRFHNTIKERQRKSQHRRFVGDFTIYKVLTL